MNTRNNKKFYLSSRIILDASLKTSISSARSSMSCYPAMRQLSNTSRLSYLIESRDNDDRFNTLELDKHMITLTTSSIISPTYFMKESVLRLISISMLLSKDYEIDFHNLMPYLIYLLSNNDIIIRESKPPNFNRDADIILSRRVIELINQKKIADAVSRENRRNLVTTLASLIISKYANGFDHMAISKELGLGNDVVSEAIGYLKSHGYRTSISKSGRIEVSMA